MRAFGRGHAGARQMRRLPAFGRRAFLDARQGRCWHRARARAHPRKYGVQGGKAPRPVGAAHHGRPRRVLGVERHDGARVRDSRRRNDRLAPLRARLAANRKARPAETCSEPISTACSTNRGRRSPSRARSRACAACPRASWVLRARRPRPITVRASSTAWPTPCAGRSTWSMSTASSRRAMIHVYHGDGKGKTTAAMGLALRMLAAGRRVVVVQFLKDGESGGAPARRAFRRALCSRGRRRTSLPGR